MKQLLGDIRALGKWAPVRAIYEVLHRSGVIGIVLRRRASRPAPEMVAPFSTWPPERFRTGWQPTADAIAGGEVTIFGETVQIGETPNWHDDGAGGSWERVAPWRINLYAKAERDVKYAWELARHRHLVVLARAASEDRPARNIATIETHLESWFEQNPPENGVHWFSNLELSIRALAWLEVLGLVGRRLTPRTRASLAAHLYHSGRHIVAHLPLTLSSMRNNHLIGDAVGLVAIGKAFPGDRSAARWVRLGDRMLKRHLPRHIAKDGSSLEDSLGYRAFVMELLAARVAVGDPPATVVRSLAAATKHAARSGVGNGPVPRFGDWDGGTALAAGPTTLSLPVASLDIAAEVSGIVDITEPVSDGSDTGGGLARLAQGPWTIYLKAGTGLSHQHADLLSVAIAHNGFWITGDPANGSYNRDPGERNYYRMSRAHNVLRIEDTDQRGPQRRFRWHYDPSCSLGAPFTEGRYRVMWGNHDAYDRLEPGHTVVRGLPRLNRRGHRRRLDQRRPGSVGLILAARTRRQLRGEPGLAPASDRRRRHGGAPIRRVRARATRRCEPRPVAAGSGDNCMGINKALRRLVGRGLRRGAPGNETRRQRHGRRTDRVGRVGKPPALGCDRTRRAGR